MPDKKTFEKKTGGTSKSKAATTKTGSGGANSASKPVSKSGGKASSADDTAQLNIQGSADRLTKEFESDRAIELLADFYPALLEHCTDEDDEVDTRAVFELLAGMLGIFVADYSQYYGHRKAMAAYQDLIDLSLSMYEARTEETE